ncbi:MAG: DUF3300 domain-containing protein [Syntrophobacteraceae bacterium]
MKSSTKDRVEGKFHKVKGKLSEIAGKLSMKPQIIGFLRRSLIGLVVVMMVPFGALSQETATSGKAFSEAELDQMLAPVALYPDSLVAQILLAATFPDQVTEADTWLKANLDLKGDALNDALDKMKWDLSVKALAPFPQVLAMMVEQTAWTQKLGEAFMAQESDVIAAVQKLRSKAYAAGNLKSSDEQQVVVKGDTVEIAPANPEVVYVPRYDPAVVYGSWWWPSYPPYAYYPVWPGVAIGLGMFGFWGGIGVGPFWGWGWGSWNWGGRSMNVNVNRNININGRNANVGRNFATTGVRNAAGRGAAGLGTAGAARGDARGAGGRPTAASVERGLSAAASRGAAGNVSRGGSRDTDRPRTGNVARGGARGTGSRGTGNVSRGGAARSSVSRGGGGARSAARGGGGGHGGGGHGGGRR